MKNGVLFTSVELFYIRILLEFDPGAPPFKGLAAKRDVLLPPFSRQKAAQATMVQSDPDIMLVVSTSSSSYNQNTLFFYTIVLLPYYY